MNKDIIYNYEPLWESWYIKDLIGKGSSGRVYKIVRNEYDEEYISALKSIIFPNQELYNSIINSLGNDKNIIGEYLEEYIKNITNEIKLLYELKGNSNIISYEDHLIKKIDANNWLILIRMEYATSLQDYLINKTLNEKEIINIGMDICKALILCHSKNILHRDIKEANIFISNNNFFKLGDFSVSKKLSKITSARTTVGTMNYMAPEVIKGEPYKESADIYSLGIMLYKLLNKGRFPFLPSHPNRINPIDMETAYNDRVSGKPICKIDNVSDYLNNIINKACSPEPSNRYQSAKEMLHDFKKYESSSATLNNIDFNSTNTTTKSNLDNGTINIFDLNNNVTKKSNTKFKIIIFTSVLILIVGIIAILMTFINNEEGKNIPVTTTSTINPTVNSIETAVENTSLSKSPEKTSQKTGVAKLPTPTIKNTPAAKTSTTAIESNKNLILNPGAESGESNWSSYFKGVSAGALTISSDYFYNGKNCFKATKTNLDDWHFYTQNVKIERGSSYTAEVYCKTVNVTDGEGSDTGAIISIGYKDSAGIYIWNYTKLTGTNNWNKMLVNFTPPVDSTSDIIIVYIGLKKATGTAYFDDVTIQKINE